MDYAACCALSYTAACRRLAHNIMLYITLAYSLTSSGFLIQTSPRYLYAYVYGAVNIADIPLLGHLALAALPHRWHMQTHAL